MAYAQNEHSIREFRIVLPMDVEEYRLGQLWSVAEASKNENGGGEGIEVVVNEPFGIHTDGRPYGCQPEYPLKANGQEYTSGQFTHKVYHLSKKVPRLIRALAPKGSLEFHEKSWNAYPYCLTIATNDYMKTNFYIVIETFHAADDVGDSPNIHNLTGRDLEKRQIVNIDIANDKIPSKDYKPEWDPTKVRSEKAQRGPLPADESGAWKNDVQPVMCCYKLVKVFFKWFGLQNKVESMTMKGECRLFLNFHRQVVCWLDNYYGLSIEDIRMIEEKTKTELDELRNRGKVRGMVES